MNSTIITILVTFANLAAAISACLCLINYVKTEKLISQLKRLATNTVTILIDFLVIIIWGLVNWGAAWIISKFTTEISGIDGIVLLAFRIGFAISTLIMILVYVWVDISIMIKKGIKNHEFSEQHKRK